MDFEERYRAIQTRDRRFDGQFFTAVHTTGIYCRPSCPARTPKSSNVSFFSTSAAAHEAGFRACKRCLPEATPGTPEWNLRDDLSARAMRLIADGAVERDGVPGLAARLGYSTRHLTRVLTDELGAGPLALSRAHRAQTARALLTATDLPVGDIAYASGFSSVRQFNDTIGEVFALTPSEIRSRRSSLPAPAGTIDLTLPGREPFDPTGIFVWLAARAVRGVEVATERSYSRTLRLAGGPAWFSVIPAVGGVRLVASLTELRDLPSLVARVRRLFDLDSDPVGIDGALRRDAVIARLVDSSPGIRLPGTVDPHEMVFRAIVGQQITVAAARTQLSLLADAAGSRFDGPEGLTTLFPTPSQIVAAGRAALVGPKARIETIMTVAAALATGELTIGFGDDRASLHDRLTAYRGIGDWTAGYLAMRVLGSPDVLLTGDVALRTGARRAGFADTIRELVERSAPLAPWRSYLSLHLWWASAVPALAGSPSPSASRVATTAPISDSNSAKDPS